MNCIVQGRARGQNDHMISLNETKMLRVMPVFRSGFAGRVKNHVPIFISEPRQRCCDFVKGRAIPDLGKIGVFPRTQGKRIRKVVILHRLLLAGRVKISGLRTKLKEQPRPSCNLETKYSLRGIVHRLKNNSPFFVLNYRSMPYRGGVLGISSLPGVSCRVRGRGPLNCQPPRHQASPGLSPAVSPVIN